MKRKRHNSTKESRKTQRTVENNAEVTVAMLVERRSREVFEMVSEENRLNKNNTSYDATKDQNYDEKGDSEDNENYSVKDMQNYRIFVEKEKRRTAELFQTIPREKMKSAINILAIDKKDSQKKLSNEEKRVKVLKKHCSYWNAQENDHTWESAMFIIKNIRASILTRNWDNVTHLLLMLFQYRKGYVSFIKQATLLNLKCNPEDDNGEILEEFFELLARSL